MSGTALMNALLGFADHIGITTNYLTDVATNNFKRKRRNNVSTRRIFGCIVFTKW
jgi:hypothetical protein